MRGQIAGFEPVWAPFAGFSVLFDFPGRSAASHGPTDGGIERESDVEFYLRLANGVRAIGGRRLALDWHLGPLPARTYHVTAWDGVNAGNVDRLAPEIGGPMRAFLGALPASSMAPPEALAVVARSRLMADGRPPIELRYESLAIHDGLGLVALLTPEGGDRGSAAFAQLLDARSALSDQAHGAWGLDPSGVYSPHVSLGYFSDAEHAARAQSRLDDWNRTLSDAVSDCRLTLSTLGVYAFSDMVTFCRLTSGPGA